MNGICGIISNSGPNGEPLACAYLPDHVGIHSWATLPTPEKTPQEKLAEYRLREISSDEMAVTYPGFPTMPTCHSGTSATRLGKDWGWRKQGEFYACNYCGSAHPASLLQMLEQGAKLGGSDWKYGWPHKFYITMRGIPNAGAGPIKWYNEHIMDSGFSEENLAKLLEALKVHADIEFYFQEGKLMYRAPAFGYQK